MLGRKPILQLQLKVAHRLHIESSSIKRIRGYDSVTFKFHSSEVYQTAKKCALEPKKDSLIFVAGWANPDDYFMNKHFVISPATLYESTPTTSEGSSFTLYPFMPVYSGMSGGPVISSDGCIFAYTNSILQTPTGRKDLLDAISIKVLELPKPIKPFDRERDVQVIDVEPGKSIPQPQFPQHSEIPPKGPLSETVPPDLPSIITSLKQDLRNLDLESQLLTSRTEKNEPLLREWNNQKSISSSSDYYQRATKSHEESSLLLEQSNSTRLESIIHWYDEKRFQEYLSFHNIQDKNRKEINDLISQIKTNIQGVQVKKSLLNAQKSHLETIIKVLEAQRRG